MELPSDAVVCVGRGKYSSSIQAQIENDQNEDSHLVLVSGVIQDNKVNRNGRKYDLGEVAVDAEIN